MVYMTLVINHHTLAETGCTSVLPGYDSIFRMWSSQYLNASVTHMQDYCFVEKIPTFTVFAYALYLQGRLRLLKLFHK